MNKYEQILHDEEQKIKPAVEKIFTSLDEAKNDPVLKNFTDEAKVKQLEAVAAKAEDKLRDIKEKYGHDCKAKIESTTLQVPAAKITNDFELQKAKLTLITLDKADQLDYLTSIDNPDDFTLVKGLLLEMATQTKDSDMINHLQKFKVNDEDAQKTRALGQLQLMLNNFSSVPGLAMHRQLAITNGGVGAYIRELLGISTTDLYFR